MGESQLGWHRVGRFFPLPCEPHVCVLFDDYSVKHAENNKPDKTGTGR